ncbi:MAG: nicotinate (nicotinamide) nucleotide adenylyltransferase [Bacteroidales bacterium]
MQTTSHILLFFGSFNTIHKGHLFLAKTAIEQYHFDEVWFVLSPLNPFKQATHLLSEKDRMQMILLSIKNEANFRFSSIELDMPQPSYTIHTLQKLYTLHPNVQFDILMGQDNLEHFYKWKEAEKILSLCTLYVYPRFEVSNRTNDTPVLPPHINLQAKLLPISSTQIREKWQKGETILPFMERNAAHYFMQLKASLL